MWLDSGIDIGLFYAGMELNKCFESIWLKHGLASNDDSDEFTNLNAQPHLLAEKLNHEFILQLSFEKSYKFTLDSTNPNLTMGHFLMMPNSLFEAKEKVSKFAHAQWAIPIGHPEKHWQKESHDLLLSFALDLIPHASSQNSLIVVQTPDIKAIEIDTAHLKTILRQTLPGIDGPWS